MKLAVFSLFVASATAFGSFGAKKAKKIVKSPATLSVEDLPGILPPVGLFDPLNFAGRASPNLLRKYREAELTHGRVAMVASLGFLVGEAVAGVTPLFEGKVTATAGILQIGEVPAPFWVSFVAAVFALETYRVQQAIVDPATASKETFGTYKEDYVAGDLGFDPLGLKPVDPEEFKEKQTKELQNGRLAMIGASGFLAQELSNKKGIFESDFGGLELPSFEIPSIELPSIELPF